MNIVDSLLFFENVYTIIQIKKKKNKNKLYDTIRH